MPTVRRFATEDASPQLLGEIRGLLDAAFAGAFSDEDWDHTLGGWHVTVSDGAVVVAHAAVVPRRLEVAGQPFRTGYVEGVATAPERHGQGLGLLAMTGLNAVLRTEYEFGALSTDRHSFYARSGWERWQGPTFVRTGSDLTRTEDEDDGVMALRFGPSTAIALTAPIICEARPGDAW
jgi:aminoglycoside 2'-N-acetyltransferase I